MNRECYFRLEIFGEIQTTRLIMFFSAELWALYTIDEDERILRHFLGHGGFSIRK